MSIHSGFAYFMVNLSLGLVIGPLIGGGTYDIGPGMFMVIRDSFLPKTRQSFFSSDVLVCGLYVV